MIIKAVQAILNSCLKRLFQATSNAVTMKSRSTGGFGMHASDWSTAGVPQ